MNGQIAMHQRNDCAHRRARGFTLIELMIAMLLGLVVIAGVTSVFLAGQQSFRTNNALGEVESSSRIAFELMARDIRGAGETGCNSRGGVAGGVVGNVLYNSTANWWSNWSNAVHGFDNGQADPAVAVGGGTGERVGGTDSLQLIGGGIAPVALRNNASNTAPYPLNPGNTPPNLKTGDIVIVCSPSNMVIMQVSAYNNADPNAPTVAHATGGVTPGNCSGDVPSYAGSGGCGMYGSSDPAPKSMLSRFNATDWYIGNNPDGGQSLYRISLVNNAGNVQPQAQEMVRNVTNMQVTYLQPPSTSFVTASAVTDWSQVAAARVELTVESNFQRAGTDAQPITRTYAATTTIRNRVD